MTTQQFLLSAWHWQPTALAATVVAVVVYVAAVRKAETRRPRAEGRPKPEGRMRPQQVTSCLVQEAPASPASTAGRPCRISAFGLRYSAFFLLALVIFLFTLSSPLDTLADGYLFSAHMLQHLLLLLVIPPLVLLALPRRPDSANGTSAFSIHPSYFPARTLLCWLCGVGAMWFWHVPTLCNAATASPLIRSVQTVSLLALGTMFWLPILAPNARRRLSPLTGVLYLFTACVGCTLLGILITFAPVSVCSIYMHPVDRWGILPLIRQDWGLTPSVDQQVGGLLMWVPACFIYLCAILSLLVHWYTAAESEPQPTPPARNAGFQSA
jgi:putative membrane protein